MVVMPSSICFRSVKITFWFGPWVCWVETLTPSFSLSRLATTPPYYDYNWTVHADMPAALREKLSQALVGLSKATPEGKEILELQRATRFVPTKADNYKGIEAAAVNAALL